MRFRNLRITWSVAWVVVAVLLCVLWVRSQGAEDRLTGHFSGSNVFRIYSSRGCLVYYVPGTLGPPNDYAWRCVFGSKFWLQVSDSRLASVPRFHLHFQEKWVTLPYWFLVGITAAVTVGPWLRQFPHRFSLRTLLIATTFVAVALGLIVWARR